MNFDQGVLNVRRSLDRGGNIGTPKNGKSRTIPMNEDVVAALRAHWHRRGIWVFCDEDGQSLCDYKCKKSLWRACRQAGLRKISWHVLRHIFAGHLVMRGAPLPTVKELLGHSMITMTMRYAHMTPDAKREAVRCLQANGTIVARKKRLVNN